MRSPLSFIAPAALALALVVSSAAQAQITAAPNSHEARVEQRIRDLYATLHITRAQDTEWNAFAQVMLNNAKAMEATVGQHGGSRATLSAPEILDNYAAISAQHALNVEKLSAAFAVLYASLSPAQQHTADEMFRHTPRRKAERLQQTK